MTEPRRELVHAVAAGLFALTVVAFLPSLWADWVNYDDEMNFLSNPHFSKEGGGLTWENLKWMWTDVEGVYIPLTWLSLEIDYEIWGLETPGGFHATSLLLHATSAVLLFFVLLALLREGSTSAVFAAAFGAALWSLHPLRTESVAWITERRDVLCGLFFMLTLLSYLRMARETPERRGRQLAITVALFACSMLSKASAMALPVVLVLLDLYPLRRFSRETLVEKIPFFAITLGLAVLAVVAQKEAGAAVTLERHGVIERGLQANYGLVFYLWKTVWPAGLSPLYLLSNRLSIQEPRFIGAILAVAAVTGAVCVWGRRRPAVAVAWLSYAILVSPVLGFVQSGPHLVADRFSYVPCVAWSALAAAGLAAIRQDVAVRATCAIVLAALAGLSIRQTTFWHDSFAMWNRVLVVEPENTTAFQGLGSAHLRRHEWREAEAQFDRALTIHPRLADAYTSRGYARMQLGELDRAMDDFDRALAIDTVRPLTDYYRGTIFARRGDHASAVAAFERSLRTAPEGWPARGAVERALAESRQKVGNR